MASEQSLFSDEEGNQSPRVDRRRQVHVRKTGVTAAVVRRQPAAAARPPPVRTVTDISSDMTFIDTQDGNAEYLYDAEEQLFYYCDEQDGLDYDLDDAEQRRVAKLYLAGGLTPSPIGDPAPKDIKKAATTSASRGAAPDLRSRTSPAAPAKPVTVSPAAGQTPSRPWKNGLFSCCSDTETCLLGCCAPCLLSKEIEEKLNDPSHTSGLWMLSAVDSPLATAGLSYLTNGMSIFASVIDCLVLFRQRKSFRRHYGIATDTTSMSDTCAVVFCKSCVRIQMANELRHIQESQPKRAA
jgi:Cys-rich protein (TIGR01571 family)